MRVFVSLLGVLAIAACAKKEEAAPAAAEPALEAAEEAAAEDPAAIAGERYMRFEGSWAETGQCQDYEVRWEIDASTINLHETHCTVSNLAATETGVRATTQCVVEGDDDGAADNFELIREADGLLTIVNEANGARTTGLYPCVESEL